jgi:hypothetical protein
MIPVGIGWKTDSLVCRRKKEYNPFASKKRRLLRRPALNKSGTHSYLVPDSSQ